MVTHFPAAYYGYYPNEHGQSGYDFRLHDLPADAQAAFRKVKDQFDWPSGGGQQRYADCYAIWPVNDNQVLAARFRDTGGDANYGRPHTLRIEVVLVHRNDVNDWPSGLVRFLSDLAWRLADTTNDPQRIPIELSHEPGEISPEIRSALHGPMLSAVLFSPHPNVRTKEMFRVVQFPGNFNTSSPQSIRESVSARDKPMNRPVRSNSASKAGRGWGKMVALLVVGLALGFGAAYVGLHQSSERRVEDRKREIRRLEESLMVVTQDMEKSFDKVKSFLELVDKNVGAITDVKLLETALEKSKTNLNSAIANSANWNRLLDLTEGKLAGDMAFTRRSEPKDYQAAIIRLQSNDNNFRDELSDKGTKFKQIEHDLKKLLEKLDEINKVRDAIEEVIIPRGKEKKSGIIKEEAGKRSTRER